jgi:hypothetical protein
MSVPERLRFAGASPEPLRSSLDFPFGLVAGELDGASLKAEFSEIISKGSVMADEEEADCEIVCEDVTGTIGSVAPFDNTTVPLDADSKGG